MSLVLITGSCGLVGSESVKFFTSKGFDIIGIDNNFRAKFVPNLDLYPNYFCLLPNSFSRLLRIRIY